MTLARTAALLAGALVAPGLVARGLGHLFNAAGEAIDAAAITADLDDLDDLDAMEASSARLPWHLHEGTLTRWADAPPPRREAFGNPAQDSSAEQADAIIRRYFDLHDLDELLGVEPDAAFVAYSVAEVLCHVAMDAANRAALNGAPPWFVVGTLKAALVGASQRIAWHTAAHFTGAYDREPFGAAVPESDLHALDWNPDTEGDE